MTTSLALDSERDNFALVYKENEPLFQSQKRGLLLSKSVDVDEFASWGKAIFDILHRLVVAVDPPF
jgi:hypothetical protein